MLLLEVGIAIIDRTVVGIGGDADPATIQAVGGNAQAIGRTLYTTYLLPFEIVSLVLTVGVIGAIVLALPERLGDRLPYRRDTISLGHPRGTDLSLPSGPLGETPIVSTQAPEEEVQVVSRDLIMTNDPDAYTTVGSRR